MAHFLITGGAGFIGSWLSRYLLTMGEVTVLDSGLNSNFSNLDPRCKFVQGTTLDAQMIEHLVSSADYVFHLAAVVGAGLVSSAVGTTLDTNILGTRNVLQSCAKYQVPVLVMSTSEVYGRGVSIPFREDDDLRIGSSFSPRWCYAVSKLACEHLALHAYPGLKAIVVRPFNVVGLGQSGTYGMVLPRFIEAASQRRQLEIYGDGSQTRSFLHVQDAVEAMTMLITTPIAYGKIYNMGNPNNEISIWGLAQQVLAKFGLSSDSILFREYDHSSLGGDCQDIPRRVPDISKIKQAIGWSPKLSLSEIIDSMA